MKLTTRYSAEIHTDCIMVYVYRSAGICAPAETAPRPATMDDAENWLASNGYTRSDRPWNIVDFGDKMTLIVDVERF